MVCNAFRSGAGAGSWSAASRAAMADVSASLRGMGRLSCIRSDLAASAAAAQAGHRDRHRRSLVARRRVGGPARLHATAIPSEFTSWSGPSSSRKRMKPLPSAWPGGRNVTPMFVCAVWSCSTGPRTTSSSRPKPPSWSWSAPRRHGELVRDPCLPGHQRWHPDQLQTDRSDEQRMWAAGAPPRQQPRQAAEEHHTAHCAKAAAPLLDVGHRGPEDGGGGEPECAGEAVLAVGAGFESTVVAGQRRRACDHPRQTGDERDGCQRCREDLQLPATAVTALRIHAVAPFYRCTLILAPESVWVSPKAEPERGGWGCKRLSGARGSSAVTLGWRPQSVRSSSGNRIDSPTIPTRWPAIFPRSQRHQPQQTP